MIKELKITMNHRFTHWVMNVVSLVCPIRVYSPWCWCVTISLTWGSVLSSSDKQSIALLNTSSTSFFSWPEKVTWKKKKKLTPKKHEKSYVEWTEYTNLIGMILAVTHLAKRFFFHCFQTELEFRSAGFYRGRKTREPGEETLEQGWELTTNSTYMAQGLGLKSIQ